MHGWKIGKISDIVLSVLDVYDMVVITLGLIYAPVLSWDIVK